MGRVFLIVLIFVSFPVFGQDAPKNEITIPSAESDIAANGELISNVIFNNIITGKLKMYANQECTMPLAIKAIKKACTDTVRITVIDKKNGDVTGWKKVPRMHEPGLLTHLRIYNPTKAPAGASDKLTFGYMIPTFTQSDIITGYKTIGYLKYEDLNSIIVPFEKKNYSTYFDRQLKEQM